MRCAFPNCRKELTVLKTDDILAHIAHIVGRSDCGPRADRSMSLDARNSHENLILLCPTHHAEIDAASGVKKYTAEKLRAMKQAHEGWVAGRLATGKPVQSNVSQFYYINIPRLATLAALSGHELDLSFGDRAPVLLERGIETTRFVVSCKHLLEHIQLRAITLEEHALASADVGLTATFQGRFRTKGMPTLESVRSGEWRSSGITEKDPHIYRNLAGGVRLVLGIDPKWIVSTTSGAHFTPSGGQSTFAGVCTIKDLDDRGSTIFATPLFIGVPRSPWDDVFAKTSRFE